jgi:hypothetical protein
MARTWGGTLARKITEQSNIAADLRPQTGFATLTAGKTATEITGVRITADTTFHFTLRAVGGNKTSCQYAAVDIVPGEVGTAEFNIEGYKEDKNVEDDGSQVTWMLIS